MLRVPGVDERSGWPQSSVNFEPLAADVRKGACSAVIAEVPLTISSTANRNLQCNACGRVTRSAKLLFNTALQPCVLAFTGLALAIVLWGFGYRLSLYQAHPPSQSLKVKLWDRQDNSQPKLAVVLAKAPEIPAALAAQTVIPARREPAPEPVATIRIAVCFANFAYLAPLRSPPIANVA